MVTTSAAPHAPVGVLTPNQSQPIQSSHSEPHAHTGAASGAVECSILTTSGAVVARATARTRPSSSGSALEVVVTDVEPRGALEQMHHSRQQVVLRMPQQAQLTMRIDSIVGPPRHREVILHPPEPSSAR